MIEIGVDEVGRGCLFGRVYAASVILPNHFSDNIYKKIKDSKKLIKTIIGNNVMIGSNSTILPVKINNNIVIGAGSVVTKNLLVKGIYAGNPAKLIKKF